MTILIIARHGKTFEPGEPPRRAGGRTDLPLTDAGREQARALGRWLKQADLYPGAVYASELQRTRETAALALNEAGYKEPVFPLAIFNEIDYGPDENQPEDAVRARLGDQALKDWDERGVPPPGWAFDPAQCVRDWQGFAGHLIADGQDCALVVTSNGIARFAPHLTGDFESFAQAYTLKLSTGALGLLNHDGQRWHVVGWNIKPE